MPEPQVPQITQAPTMAPVSQAPSGNTEDINSILSSVSQQMTAALPPQYIQGTDVDDPRTRLHPVAPFTPRDTNRQPMTNQATSVRQARSQNAFAELSNLVGHAGNVIAQRKQENLKNDMTQVLKSKQHIAEAQAILQMDPKNAMAKAVLDANMKAMGAILNDPKKQKQLVKALDISLTDADKNKTPEIKAGQEALSEFKNAGIFNNDNPAEAAIAAAAAQGKTPEQMKQQSQQQSLVDKVLAKDLPTISANPQYAEALKQREAAQKQMVQYVIPRMITAQEQKDVAFARDNNAAARERYKGTIDLMKENEKALAAANLQTQKAKDAAKLQGQRDAAAMARTTKRVDAMIKVADDNRLGRENQAKLKAQAVEQIDKEIKTVTDTLGSYGKREFDIKNSNLSDDEKTEQLKLLQLNKQNDNGRLLKLQELRKDRFGESIPPPPTTPAEEKSFFQRTYEYFHGPQTTQKVEGTSDGQSDITTRIVGTNLSDESDDEAQYGSSDGDPNEDN